MNIIFNNWIKTKAGKQFLKDHLNNNEDEENEENEEEIPQIKREKRKPMTEEEKKAKKKEFDKQNYLRKKALKK